MDQRVSPVTTVWLAGSCPSWKAAAGGGTCDVSCAAFELSARAWVVSWATSGGATTPASSPATRASRAARSERQIVVLLIQRLRERFERFRLAPGHGCSVRGHLRRGLGPREVAGAFAATPTPAPTPARRQQQYFPRDDLGDVARLLLTIFPRAVLDAPFDVDAVALLHVLLGEVRQLGALVVPADDAMPFGLLLLLPTLPRPLPAGRQREVRHAGAVGGAPHLGIGP